MSPVVTEYLLNNTETQEANGTIDGNVFVYGEQDVARFLGTISKKKRAEINKGLNVVVLVETYYYEELIEQMRDSGFYQL